MKRTVWLVREDDENESACYMYKKKPAKLKRRNTEWGNVWPWNGGHYMREGTDKLLLGYTLKPGEGPICLVIEVK